jgi:phage gpG-like protein
MPKRNKFDISHLQRAVDKKLHDLPDKIGNRAERHFKQSFRNKGFTDRTLEKWKPTKYPNNRGSLMNRSGKLKRSVKKFRVTNKKAVVTAGGPHVPYAPIQNEGGTVHPTVTKKMRGYFRYKHKETGLEAYKNIANTKKQKLDVNIPQRKFMGNSYQLNQDIKKLIASEIKRVFK